ncbi:MAG: hypothetical protein V5A57_01535 [Candidatus Paceibacterota bacterium]
MKTRQISKWIRINGSNLEIGNFGNDGGIPKSLSCRDVEEEVPGSVIVRDDIEGNLILDNLVIGDSLKIMGEARGLVQANNLKVGGFAYIFKENLKAEFVARNSNMKGLFFLTGNEPFWSIDLSSSEFEHVLFYEAMQELNLKSTVIKETLGFYWNSLRTKPSIELNEETSTKEIRTDNLIFE